MQFLTKVFYFCAAHQYGHDDWSKEKNEAVFGDDAKVHGHNYTLEVTVKGSINPETGFTSEVVFETFEKSLIYPSVLGGTLNNGEYYIFDFNDILKI